MKKTTLSRSQAEAAQKEYFRGLAFDSAPLAALEGIPGVLCFIKDREGRTYYSSAQWARRHGFDEPWQMILKTDDDLTPGRLAEGYLADDRKVFETGEPIIGRVESCLDNVGLPDWHLTSKFPLRNARGFIVGLLGVSRPCMGREREGLPDRGILPALRILQEDLTKFPSPRRLASACSLSARQVQRRFLSALGVSPRQYWMKCRIRAACESLREGGDKMSVLAERLGFCDQSSFTAQFRRHTGLTPTAYARERRG